MLKKGGCRCGGGGSVESDGGGSGELVVITKACVVRLGDVGDIDQHVDQHSSNCRNVIKSLSLSISTSLRLPPLHPRAWNTTGTCEGMLNKYTTA